MTPSRPVNMTGSEKAKTEMLVTTRAALGRRDIYLPAGWLPVKREVLSYRRDDKHIVQDCVMALAGAVKIATENYLGTTAKRSLDLGKKTFVRQGTWT